MIELWWWTEAILLLYTFVYLAYVYVALLYLQLP